MQRNFLFQKCVRILWSGECNGGRVLSHARSGRRFRPRGPSRSIGPAAIATSSPRDRHRPIGGAPSPACCVDYRHDDSSTQLPHGARVRPARMWGLNVGHCDGDNWLSLVKTQQDWNKNKEINFPRFSFGSHFPRSASNLFSFILTGSQPATLPPTNLSNSPTFQTHQIILSNQYHHQAFLQPNLFSSLQSLLWWTLLDIMKKYQGIS